MLNIFGTQETINLYDEKNVLRYEYYGGSYQLQYTYDSNGKEITFESSDGIRRGFDIITQDDINHFLWLHDRFIKVYKESENADYLIRMRNIINKL
jgi:hypothetical protein